MGVEIVLGGFSWKKVEFISLVIVAQGFDGWYKRCRESP